MPPVYKLSYFNGKGRAETARLTFAAAGIKFEDIRVEKADWPAKKSTTPWGSMPILEVDGRVLGQSIAISRFIAKEGGLMGKNNFEAGLIDAIVDATTEIREKGIAFVFTPDGPAKDAALKDFVEKTLGTVLPNLEKSLTANTDKSGFFVGSKLSLADIHFYSVIDSVLPTMPTVLASYPGLKALYDRVAATPKIAEYVKRRPATAF